MNTLEQAHFIANKLIEQVDDLPDDQPFTLECSEVRAIATTMQTLLDAVIQFSEIGLESVPVCLVATDALENPSPEVVRKLTVLSSIQHKEIRATFNALAQNLHPVGSTKQ